MQKNDARPQNRHFIRVFLQWLGIINLYPADVAVYFSFNVRYYIHAAGSCENE